MYKLRDSLVVCVLFVSVCAMYAGLSRVNQRIDIVAGDLQYQYSDLQTRLDTQAKTLNHLRNGITTNQNTLDDVFFLLETATSHRTILRNFIHSNKLNIRELTQQFDLSVLDACGIITDGYGHGSCVAIGEDLVLTAGHCLKHEGLWVEINGRKFDILEQWQSEKYDVGFVRIDGKVSFVELGLMPEVLEEIYVVGAPASPDFVTNISKGVVTKIGLDWWEYENAVVTDAAGWYGNSGGPVFSKDGKIVAILVAGPESELDNVNVCVPVCQIRSALRTYLSR